MYVVCAIVRNPAGRTVRACSYKPGTDQTQSGNGLAPRVNARSADRHVLDSLWVAGISNGMIPSNEHGRRRMCLKDKRGFPCANPKQANVVKDFQTSDPLRTVVTMSKEVGTYVGRVAVRTTGSFDITTKAGAILWISHRFSTPIHSSDGYNYQ